MKRIAAVLLACSLILALTCTAFAADYEYESFWSNIRASRMSLPNTNIINTFSAKQKTDSANQRVLFRFFVTDSQSDSSKVDNFRIRMQFYSCGGSLLDTLNYVDGGGTSVRSGVCK